MVLSPNPDKGSELLPSQVKVVKWDAESAQGRIDYAGGGFSPRRTRRLTSPVVITDLKTTAHITRTA